MKLYIPAQPELPTLIACLSLPRCRERWLDLAPGVNRDQCVKYQVSEILPGDRVGARAGCRIQSDGRDASGNSQGAAVLGTSVRAARCCNQQASDHKRWPGGMLHISHFLNYAKLRWQYYHLVRSTRL